MQLIANEVEGIELGFCVEEYLQGVLCVFDSKKCTLRVQSNALFILIRSTKHFCFVLKMNIFFGGILNFNW